MIQRLGFVLVALLPSAACIVGDDGGPDLDLSPDAKTAPLRIVQHNVEKNSNAIDNAVHKAMSAGADGIALEEVCPSQLADLVAQHPNWTIGAVPAKRPAETGCDLPNNLHAIPNVVVIWMGGTDGRVTTYPVLSDPAASPGEMACVAFDYKKVPVDFCAVHLISADWTDTSTNIKYNGATLREVQTTKIKRLANDEWFAGNRNHFGVVAGDFNGTPDTAPLDKMYAPQLGGTGDFTEYNRSGGSRDGTVTAHSNGDNTVDGLPYAKKIDYVFFSTNRVAIDGPAVDIEKDQSDHDMLTSTARMQK